MIYFCHGVPGGPDDITIMNIPSGVDVISADILANGGISDAVAQFDKATSGQTAQIDLVGFSIGAMFALQIAAARPDRVRSLTLISPAAPLNLGSFLDRMAGKPVFTLAAKSPRALFFLTTLQGVLLWVAPNSLIKPLFAKCGPDEQALLLDQDFRDTLIRGLHNTYARHRKSYVQILSDYVTDWSAILPSIRTPTTIWHGDADTWAPVEMAYALKSAVSGPVTLHIVKGGEHYTTLTKADLT